MTTKLRGILHVFINEASNEGYWAFQDERFIATIPNTTRFGCLACGLYWDSERLPFGPPDTTDRHPDLADHVFCAPGAHSFVLLDDDEGWSREGLYLLATGDRLLVRNNDVIAKIEFNGTVDLYPCTGWRTKTLEHPVRSLPRNVDAETWTRWFTERYPAELVPLRRRE